LRGSLFDPNLTIKFEAAQSAMRKLKEYILGALGVFYDIEDSRFKGQKGETK
jgi:hypothetical protein